MVEQHTPGPWSIGKSVMGCRSIEAGDILIATVEDAPGDANAHLIAGAPGLLALARRLLETADEVGLNGPLAREARAAIAKATGAA